VTRRERVLTSLKHKQPDRIPVDLGGMDSTGITAVAYNKLKKYLCIETGNTKVYDPYQQVAVVDFNVLDIIGADVLAIFPEPEKWKISQLPDGSMCEVPERWNAETLPDGSQQVVFNEKIIAKRPSKSWYFEQVDYPLANAKSIKEIESNQSIFENFDWPFFVDETIEQIGKRAKHLYETTDYALMGNFAVHIFMGGQLLRGFEQFMIDLVLNPDIARCIMDNLSESYIKRFEKYSTYIGPYVQIINVNDDLGTQESLQVSPETYRKLIKPYQKKLYRFIKEHFNGYLFLHSDGSIYDIIPDLIDIGVDIINPVQFSARNMDLEKLKREFGRYITFWGGGCDTQHILPYSDTQTIKNHVKRCIKTLFPGGGFVFCQIHNIQPDVPPENIMAMYEAVKECYS